MTALKVDLYVIRVSVEVFCSCSLRVSCSHSFDRPCGFYHYCNYDDLVSVLYFLFDLITYFGLLRLSVGEKLARPRTMTDFVQPSSTRLNPLA